MSLNITTMKFKTMKFTNKEKAFLRDYHKIPYKRISKKYARELGSSSPDDCYENLYDLYKFVEDGLEEDKVKEHNLKVKEFQKKRLGRLLSNAANKYLDNKDLQLEYDHAFRGTIEDFSFSLTRNMTLNNIIQNIQDIDLKNLKKEDVSIFMRRRQIKNLIKSKLPIQFNVIGIGAYRRKEYFEDGELYFTNTIKYIKSSKQILLQSDDVDEKLGDCIKNIQEHLDDGYFTEFVGFIIQRSSYNPVGGGSWIETPQALSHHKTA